MVPLKVEQLGGKVNGWWTVDVLNSCEKCEKCGSDKKQTKVRKFSKYLTAGNRIYVRDFFFEKLYCVFLPSYVGFNLSDPKVYHFLKPE